MGASIFGSQDLLKDKRLAHYSPKAPGPLPWTPSMCPYPRSNFPNPVLNFLVAEELESAETLVSEFCRG